MYIKPYNQKNLEMGLQELASQLTPLDVTDIAHAERLHPNTVKNYLRGEVSTLAIAKAILDRGRGILLNRTTIATT